MTGITSKIKNYKFKILLGVVLLLIGIQFIPVKHPEPKSGGNNDLLISSGAQGNITQLLHTACYDCHSNETVYPGYANIAPVSWWINHHINEGKEHLNFSEWNTYESKRKTHKAGECVEMLEKKEMPLSSYTLIHKDARLSDEQRNSLIQFFKSL